MDDLLREFLTETAESLEIVDRELVTLEREPNNKGVLDRIFRLVHTVKGTCGFLGLPRLERVAHASETLLGKFRDGALVVTPPSVTLILSSLDRIKAILADLEAREAEPTGDDGPLIAELERAAAGDSSPAPEPIPEPVSAAAAEPAQVIASAETPDAAPAPAQDPAPDAAKAGPAVAQQSIRVNVDVLEDLMTMVSELVLTRNQLLDMVRRLDNSEFKVPLQRLSNVTAELQEGVMKTRMQPIGSAWQKLPRIIRDLAHDLGKRISLEMIGAETELDRQVLELIRDPLTHMVRNSADHGLENPAERKAAGKSETGTITLKAFQQGGHIIVQIIDDGRGLHTERIKAKALERGLAGEAELERMSDAQIHKFIFHPGFSTAAKVTNVSGRGVGMDVVRTNIELIGGAIDLQSKWGQGSTFTIKIPLTLAIVSALIVEASGQRFAIPQTAVRELVRAKANSEHRIEAINGTPVFRLRNRLLPLVFLSDTLQLGARPEGAPADEAYVVVSRVANQTFGIVVDSVFETQEIVVKPPATLLRDIAMFSGNTILGDGSVIMIIDPAGVARTIAREERDAGDARGTESSAEGRDRETTTLLVFRAGTPEPKAIPLSLVTRLEEVDVARIESANGRRLVQYRGRLMPLVMVSPAQAPRSDGRQPVLVFTDGDRSMGLAVDEIIDIVDDRFRIELKAGTPGALGSAIIKGQATEVLDVAPYLTEAYPDWFAHADRATRSQGRILLVDDSAFFRNLLAPLLETAGYEVVPVDGPDAAFRLKEDGARFDCILSDIEMPGTDGFAFASAVRKDEAWGTLPLVALSSLAPEEHEARTRAAGFDQFVAKSDRERLLAVLAATLKPQEIAA